MEIDLSSLGTMNTMFAALFRFFFYRPVCFSSFLDIFKVGLSLKLRGVFLVCGDSKLGVPIKTLVSASVLEEAINGTVPTLPLALGKPVSRKVGFSCSFVLRLYK